MICAKFGYHWFSGSGVEDFKKMSIYILVIFCHYLTLGKDETVHMNKCFASTLFS